MKIIQIAKSILQPLQGFFNASIFIYQKVDIIRCANSETTVFEAFMMIFRYPGEIPEKIVAGISMVIQNSIDEEFLRVNAGCQNIGSQRDGGSNPIEEGALEMEEESGVQSSDLNLAIGSRNTSIKDEVKIYESHHNTELYGGLDSTEKGCIEMDEESRVNSYDLSAAVSSLNTPVKDTSIKSEHNHPFHAGFSFNNVAQTPSTKKESLSTGSPTT